MVVGRVFASGWTIESGRGLDRGLWGVGLWVCGGGGGLDSGFVGRGVLRSCSTDFVHCIKL